SNVVPKAITGTSPVGGSGNYTYLWQKSYNLAGAPANIPSSDVADYTPTSLEPAGNVWFRRIVTDNITSLADTSKWVHIIVQPAITGNLVGKDTVICYGQNPLSLIPLNAGPSNGNGIYSYQWLENLTDTGWNTSPDAAGTSTLNSYDPPSLTTTTYYKRLVTSGRCIDYSPTITVSVLPLITGNIITRSDSVICEGSAFDLLAASAAGGGAGAGSYTYQWQDSAASVSGNWLPASGINNGQTHAPDTSIFTVTDTLRYFRRVVISGPDDVCKSYSSPIRMTRYARIISNSVSADNTICSGSIPVPLTGTSPQRGSGIYNYIWQDSIRNGSWSDRGTLSSLSFSSGLTDSTWYRRIVNSSECTNTSNTIVINVHKPIANNTISLLSGAGMDTTLCFGALPNLLKGGASPPTGGTGIPGSYSYQWSSSPDNSIWTDISPSGNGTNYQPAALNATTFYRRRVSSGLCSGESSVITVNILPLIQNNIIAADQTVCRDEAPDPLVQASGQILSGGAGTYSYLWLESADLMAWSPATGTNNASNGTYQAPALTDPMHYRRIIRSGANNCCIDTSNIIDIAVDVLPAGFTYYAGPDTNLYTFDNIYYMSADPPWSGATGVWRLISGSGTGDIEDTSDNMTMISGLSLGLNRFEWTVTLGACVRSDIVDVNVYNIVVPEGFSPNDDGLNDLFVIIGLDTEKQIAELTIINSAGAKVFETSNRTGSEWKDWDGKTTAGDNLPEGTYYYLLRLTSKGNDQVFRKSGFVILKRY
ncbi:MAG: gliding motility-associated C-terminal domain-containing protein, partial [Bacteroidales bacterium]|nr:gliding motility-associated C-terminal domain-containing protein [Bacteroidales bacterium]